MLKGFRGKCECGHTTFTCDLHEDSISICDCIECRDLRHPRTRVLAALSSIAINGPCSLYNDPNMSEVIVRAFCFFCGTAIYAVEAAPVDLAVVHLATLFGPDPGANA